MTIPFTSKTNPICPDTKQECKKPCSHAPEPDDRRETKCLGILILKCPLKVRPA